MGTTPLPLKLLLLDLPAFPETLVLMIEQGHRIDFEPVLPLAEYDMILGPKCWRLLPEHFSFITLAIKEARAYARATRPKAKKGPKRGTTEA